MRRLAGRRAVVTGGAQGIGAATATRLAAEGAHVRILDRNGPAAVKTATNANHSSLVMSAGGSVSASECDVTVEEDVERAFAEFVDEHRQLDILVNNAGITRDNLIHRLDAAEWALVIATNLTSSFLGSRAAQRHMVSARYGRIINLSSRSALGNRGQANYAAAKAGVQGLTATLAIELGPFGITVNAVAPGYIDTPMTNATALRIGSSAEEHQRLAEERIPLGRVGQPEEVAAAIAFFASDDSSYVSGQTLYLNGGARG